MACHGPNGNSSNAEWPRLAGQNAAYIEHQLHLLHDGRRTGKVGDAAAAMMPADGASRSATRTSRTSRPTTRSRRRAAWRPILRTGRPDEKLYRSGDRAARNSRLRGLPRPDRAAAIRRPAIPHCARSSPCTSSSSLVPTAPTCATRKNEKGASYGGDNGNIMHTIAARLNDEDMRNLASYMQGMR